ncbi:MAG TPA: xanthine dehydrogenase family protein molybdopterin-binding subunit [Polyangia bacterium]|jgi:CO/xanthine dehydrogenase Mo-binding subunit|nr:xanthine dehydrogenase family protein molybdopterin-binding subunit [Polyangia bacterium]
MSNREAASTGSVGHNVPRAEGIDKVTGRARYVDDLVFPGMLYGRTVRSTVPCGRIRAIVRDPGFDWSGFTYVDASDIPPGGKNVVTLITEDQPYLAKDRVRHREEPIALLAHADRRRLEEGLAHIRVEYEEDEAPILDFTTSPTVLKEITIAKGDLAEGFAQAEVIVEGTYRTGHQEQLYIEPNGVIALPDGAHGAAGPGAAVTVYGSLQCPYYVVKALRGLFGLPEDRVRVVQMTTGGGFGGKEEYPSVLAGHAALLAHKAGRSVKMIYDRTEDMLATTKRHPAFVRHRTGLTRDGRLVAVDIDLMLDGGAYVTLSPVVLSRACIHATGPYRVPHVRIRGRVMMTHTPPNGAFRGFGAPQSQFAAEVQMDRIAEELGMDPVELRRKNLLRLGDATATGQVLRESVSAEEVLDRALKLHEERRRARGAGSGDGQGGQAQEGRQGMRGTGIACFLHGSGFTGGGEVRLASRAGIELTKDGVRLRVGSTEIGQGTRTMHAQIVSDAFGIPYGWVETSDPDTAAVPDSGPTVASRTCMVVGRILQRAAAKIRAELGPYQSPEEFRERARALLAARGRLVVDEQYEKPGEIQWSDETYQGDAYGAYAWGCNIADVEVDPLTYEVRCTDVTAVIDIGKAIHPLLAEGQIEGGTLQAVGWALCENVVMQGGRMANPTLTNYIIPTTLDAPRMAVEIVENPYSQGPFGAKGVGECPMDGPAAAVANAISRATGVRVTEIPATPERLMEALDQAEPGRSGR